MNEIKEISDTIQADRRHAANFDLGTIVRSFNPANQDYPYRMVVHDGVINLHSGGFYPYSACDKQYELVRNSIVIGEK